MVRLDRILLVIVLALLIPSGIACYRAGLHAAPVPVTAPITPDDEIAAAPLFATFAPYGSPIHVITAEVNRARKEIRVMAYSFTADALASALIAAKARGVDVRVIQDGPSTMARGAQAPRLKAAGIEVAPDCEHRIHHNKVLILDRYTVITGSYNFSVSAETSNAENILLVRDDNIAAAFLNDWRRHREHCRELK